LVEIDFTIEILHKALSSGILLRRGCLPFDKKFTGESQKDSQFKQLQFKCAMVGFDLILLEGFCFWGIHSVWRVINDLENTDTIELLMSFKLIG
jgi:hypothetical protein